jgi:ribose/xylose/arabinose/galactoside ABC-type transport system permease subunit
MTDQSTGAAVSPLRSDTVISTRIKLRQFALPVLIIALAMGIGIVEPRFWSGANLSNLLRQLAPLMVLSVGQAFAVIGGGLDLSVAATLAASGAVGVIAMSHAGVAIGVAAMLGTGLCVGLINGALITIFRVSPFIITLGTMSVLRGLTLVITGGLPLYNIPSRFLDIFGDATLFGVPAGGIIALCCMLLGAFLLKRTVFGRYVYAVGANTTAAFNSGVKVGQVTLMIYGVSGLMAGIASVILTSWVSAAQPLAGSGLDLMSIAVVVVGGAALTGGTGSMIGTLYGAIILGMLSNGLNMLGVSSFYQTTSVGVIIIIAVILDRLRNEQ